MKISWPVLAIGFLAAACGDPDLKAEGEPCVASSECGVGLVCDFNATPQVCKPMGTPQPDANESVIDAGDIDATVFDASPPGTPDATPLPDAAIPDAAVPDATPTAAPVIVSVAWTHLLGCTMNIASDVTIVVTATDADTALGNLTYAGSVTNCTGTIADVNSTVNCPQVGAYAGTVTVSDPEANSATQLFTINPCVDGTAP